MLIELLIAFALIGVGVAIDRMIVRLAAQLDKLRGDES
jgi:hypothetical protein